MKGTTDKIFIATTDKYKNPQECEFNIVLQNPPTAGILYREYIAKSVVDEMLKTLKVVCGKTAMRYVQKQINKINEYVEIDINGYSMGKHQESAGVYQMFVDTANVGSDKTIKRVIDLHTKEIKEMELK